MWSKAQNDLQILHALMSGSDPAPRDAKPDIDPALERIILKATAVKPATATPAPPRSSATSRRTCAAGRAELRRARRRASSSATCSPQERAQIKTVIDDQLRLLRGASPPATTARSICPPRERSPPRARRRRSSCRGVRQQSVLSSPGGRLSASGSPSALGDVADSEARSTSRPLAPRGPSQAAMGALAAASLLVVAGVTCVASPRPPPASQRAIRRRPRAVPPAEVAPSPPSSHPRHRHRVATRGSDLDRRGPTADRGVLGHVPARREDPLDSCGGSEVPRQAPQLRGRRRSHVRHFARAGERAVVAAQPAWRPRPRGEVHPRPRGRRADRGARGGDDRRAAGVPVCTLVARQAADRHARPVRELMPAPVDDVELPSATGWSGGSAPGGMGIVYEAFDEERRSRVAVKTLRSLSTEALASFKREFRSLQDLHHPNLVTFGELVQHGESCFLSMELITATSSRTCAASAASTRGTRCRPSASAGAGPSPRFTGEPVPHASPARSTKPPAAGPRPARPGARRAPRGRHGPPRHQAAQHPRDAPRGAWSSSTSGWSPTLDIDAAPERHSLVGTPAYMAPEQAARSRRPRGGLVQPSACSSTRRSPGGSPSRGRADRGPRRRSKRATPPRPSASRRGTPPDLDALCARAPPARPGDAPDRERILCARCAHADRRAQLGPAADVAGRPLFVGRDAASSTMLDGAFSRHAALGEAVAVLVQGESGVGKSSLVRQLPPAAHGRDRTTVVLTGRCYEREAVPYKAFDGDHRRACRMRLPRGAARRRFLPARRAALVQVFPVLRRIPASPRRAARSRRWTRSSCRARAFAALRELSPPVASASPSSSHRRLQWADADSRASSPTDAPPAGRRRCLLVMTATERHERLRDDGQPSASAADGRVARSRLQGDVCGAARRLAGSATRRGELAEKLLGAPASSEAHARAIAEREPRSPALHRRAWSATD